MSNERQQPVSGSALPAASRRPPLPDRMMPRSPAEALEPRRGPVRPRNLRERQPAKKLGPQLRALNAFLTCIAVLLGVVALGVAAFEQEVDKAGPLREAKTFIVPERIGAQDIARRLEADGVITSPHLFVAHYLTRAALSGTDKQKFVLKSGEYNFEPGVTMREVADAIGKGRSVSINVTMPEGLTSWQIVERLKANQGLTGDITRVPAEGTLMPETYKVPKGMPRSAIIEMMQTKQREAVAAAWAARQQGLPLKSLEEAMILASIVEKETGRRDERERVAAVFVNRLRKGMRLQSDPTILYGLAGGQVQWGKPITRTDINSRTPHNTYVIAALPPSPICNPGVASINAVLKPAATSELFFVADGRGGHIFSETVKDHNTAVQNWRKAEKEIRARAAERQAQASAAAAQGKQAEQPVEVVQVPAQVIAAEEEGAAPAQPQPARKGAPVVTVPPKRN